MSNLRFTTAKILQVGGVSASMLDAILNLSGANSIDGDAVQIDRDDLLTALSDPKLGLVGEIVFFLGDVISHARDTKSEIVYLYS